jgi:hypothetical protein
MCPYLLAGVGLRDELKLDFFGDESHDSKRELVMTMAGLLAPRANWSQLWVKWKDALAADGVTVFHAAECEGGQREFKGWSRDRINRFQQTLIDLIVDPVHDAIGYSVSLALGPYRDLTPRLRAILKFPKGLSVSGPLYDPYFILYQHLVEIACTEAYIAKLPRDEGIGFTFDRHNFWMRAKGVAETTFALRDFGHRIRGAGFMDKAKIAPLQAADLLAYETYRYEAETHLGSKPARWQYTALKARIGKSVFWDRDYLESLVALNEQRINEAQARVRERDAAKKHRPRDAT